MKEKTDIWFYIIIGLVCLGLLALPVALAEALYGTVDQSIEYKRGYMDGFRDGMLMLDTKKLEREVEMEVMNDRS